MRPPYPVAIVPLLPQFLQRRRAKLDFPLRAMEELGIDRPALFFALNLAHLAAEAGATDADLGSPYATTHDLAGHGLAARVAAEGAGLVERAGELTRLTAKGRE
ncbi:MAG: hypothetical protein ACRDF0_11995, partial [Candidatus Limnocylindria bacterium]